MDKDNKKPNRGYNRYPYRETVEEVKPRVEIKPTPAPKIPTELERRQEVCALNNIQWEDSIASLSLVDFDAFVSRRLKIRSKR